VETAPVGISVRVAELISIEEYRQRYPKAIAFQRLGQPERSAPPAPTFSLGTLPGELARIMMSEFDTSPPGCYTIRHGRITSDGIILHREAALWSYAGNLPHYHVHVVVGVDGWDRGSLPVRYVPGAVALVFGPGHGIYGHWLIDFLPRFFLLAEAGYDIGRLRFIMPVELPSFALEFLRMLGVPLENILFHDHSREQLLFDEIILPSGIRTSGRFHSIFARATAFWLTRVGVPPPTERPSERLFISRAKVHSGRVLENRDELENIAVSEGYTLLEPQRLSLREQIALFRRTVAVVGEYGSGLHSTMFGAPSLGALVLRGTSVAPGFLQTELAAAFQQRLGYVWGQSEVAAAEYRYNVDEGDFRLGLACLAAGEKRTLPKQGF
jgi:hypothetical protein